MQDLISMETTRVGYDVCDHTNPAFVRVSMMIVTYFAGN